jgi:hypothetical protein
MATVIWYAIEAVKAAISTSTSFCVRRQPRAKNLCHRTRSLERPAQWLRSEECLEQLARPPPCNRVAPCSHCKRTACPRCTRIVAELRQLGVRRASIPAAALSCSQALHKRPRISPSPALPSAYRWQPQEKRVIKQPWHRAASLRLGPSTNWKPVSLATTRGGLRRRLLYCPGFDGKVLGGASHAINSDYRADDHHPDRDHWRNRHSNML